MSELKRLRESLNRTQEKVVEDLSALAVRLYEDQRIKKPPTFTVRQLSRWESANPPWPHPAMRAVLEAYWRRPVEQLGFRPRGSEKPLGSVGVGPAPLISRSLSEPPLVVGSSPLTDEGPPPWLADITTGTEARDEWLIGADEIELLREAASELYAKDQKFGGDKLWKRTKAHLYWVHHMIDRGTYDDEMSKQLHAVAGDYSTSLGWFCYDAGLHTKARQYFAESLNAAHFTSDDVLASRTLSNMSRQAVDLNKGREAVRFARLAQTHAELWNAPTRVTALLAIREAQGYARIGDIINCEAAIKRAWMEWERGGDDRDPDWALFLNLAEMTCLEGMCRLDLGQTARAQRLLAESERLQDVAHGRNRGMCLGSLSAAALANGDVDHSVAATKEALLLVEGGMSSTRAATQLKIVHDGLIPHRRASGVGDLLEQIRAHVA
ncbi:hypothetical protein [Streptomyces sp. 4F14]|uniref:hypothetical protein n=1 Tax=Streptomyces sp. 4F14 TaxID=3394380 RepID=UPI003A89022B